LGKVLLEVIVHASEDSLLAGADSIHPIGLFAQVLEVIVLEELVVDGIGGCGYLLDLGLISGFIEALAKFLHHDVEVVRPLEVGTDVVPRHLPKH
jgi:hypothetical protein